MKAIMMTKLFWLNSYFSVAKYYGSIRIEGKEYRVMPQTGDLLRVDFIKFYKKLGRDKFMEIMQANNHASDKELKAVYDKALEEAKTESKNKNVKQQELFEQ